MLKKILILSVLLAGGLSGWADDRSAVILRRISATLDGYKSYEVEFSVVVRGVGEGGVPSVSGRYVVGGERYFVDVDPRRVYCDGKTRYEVDRQNREVTIDRVNPADRTFLANPTRTFEFLDGTFSHSLAAAETFGGRSCDVIVLVAVDKSSGLGDARLYVDRATGLPAGVIYSMGGSSSGVEVSIGKITPLRSVDPKTFVFDRNEYRDYELIDFR